jgi:hypothetical protein
MSHVAQYVVEPWQPALITQFVHCLTHAACTNGCGAPRLTSTLRVFSGQLRMEPQLVLQILIRAAAADRPQQTVQPFAKDVHGDVLPALRLAAQ